jgi:lysine biosynthesis protein LysW
MRNTGTKVLVAECPECESYIRFHNKPKVGQLIICPECEERLEVREVSPLKLDWAFEDYDPDVDDEWS